MVPFLIKVVLISSSGALAPGPLTAATMAIGTKDGWKGGFKVAVGHLIVELPLVVIIALGLYAVFNPTFLRVSSFLGGFFMIYFAYLTIRDSFGKINSSAFGGYPLTVGVTLSALNPFFILWWIGIGSPLIMEAIANWGFLSIVPFYIAHVWLDFAWLTGIAHATSFSERFERVYRLLIFILGLLLLAFGIDFLMYGLLERRLLF